MSRASEQQVYDVSFAGPRSNGLWGHLDASFQFRAYSPKALLVKIKFFRYISPPHCCHFWLLAPF